MQATGRRFDANPPNWEKRWRFRRRPADMSGGKTMRKIIRNTLLAGAALTLTAGLSAVGLPLPGPLPPPDNQKLAHDIFKEIVEVHSVHAVGTKGVADILVRYLKAGGSDAHAAQAAEQPEHDQDDEHQPEHSAQATAAVTAVSVVSAAAEQQHEQNNN
jgi:hypothetical protein